MKLKALTILGLVMITALFATTFAVYSYAETTRIRAVNEEYGEMPCENYEMHGGGHNSMMHNQTEESHHRHHGCH